MTAPGITAAHEAWQPPGAEEQWSDSFYFGGGDGRGLAFYSRIGRRPNEGVTEGALGIWLPGPGLPAELRARRGRRATDRRRPGRVRLRAAAGAVGAALRRRRAPVRARRAHRHRPRRLPRRSPCRGALRFTAWGEPLSFGSGLADGVASAPLRAAGLDRRACSRSTGAATRSPGAGMRDHSWGVRDWQRRAVVALVRHGRRPRQLRDAQQRRDSRTAARPPAAS